MSTYPQNANPVLVPIGLDALVVGAPANNTQDFNGFTLDWIGLANGSTPNLPQGMTPIQGVHLHWSLPDGIAQGIALDRTTNPQSGGVSFRYVPNRWMVVRFGPLASTPGPQPWAAWVIQSDFLDSSKGSNSYVVQQVDGRPAPATIGFASTKLNAASAQYAGDKTSSLNPGSLFLTAVGPGDVSFAAWQPGVNNVFAFTDTTPELLHSPNGAKWSYMVVGWYSDPTADNGDPLFPATDPCTLQTALQALGWSLAELAITNPDGSLILQCSPPDPAGNPSFVQPPYVTICHGLATGVVWHPGDSAADAPPNNVPLTTAVDVTVANTSLDALAARVERALGVTAAIQTTSAVTGEPAYDLDEMNEFMEQLDALMFNMMPSLSLPGANHLIMEARRQSWFAATPGGIQWTTAPAASGGAPPPPLNAAQLQLLALLNAQQVKYDTDLQLLQSMQWNLYALWSKAQYAQPSGPPQPQGYEQPPATMDWAHLCTWLQAQIVAGTGGSVTYYDRVQQQLTALETDAAGFPDPAGSGLIPLPDPNADSSAQNSIQTIGTALFGDTFVLKPIALEPFFKPMDPVVLANGIPPAAKYTGAAYDANDTLPCRLLADTITGVAGVTATTGGLNIPIVPSQTNLPAPVNLAIAALCTEAFFLDVGNAAWIAQAGNVSLGTLQTDITNRQNLTGTPPPAALAPASWTQPFTPLYLNWTVEWLPTDLSVWTFDGNDYVYGTFLQNGPDGRWQLKPSSVDTTPEKQQYSGLTVLTSHAFDVFSQRINDYLTQAGQAPDPNGTDLQKMAAEFNTSLQTWNMMSQSIGGFHDGLLMRSNWLSQILPASDPTFALIQGQTHGTSDPSKSVGDPRPGAMAPYFFPVRAGFFRFTTLQIIDCFGQTVELTQTNGNPNQNPGSSNPPWQTFVPYADDALSTTAPWYMNDGKALLTFQGDTNPTPPNNWLVLPPRVCQPARLDLQFALPPNSTAATNPVHGWLLPNHLDQGLSVYDAAGNPQGEVLGISQPGQNPFWAPAPVPNAPQSITDIADPVLQNAVALIASQSAGFQDFLGAIDETMWQVDPLGQRQDQDMSVLVGQPLALVQVTLQLQLRGLPAADQSWSDTSATTPDNGVLLTQTFPVRMGDFERGDDGVIGYFTPAGDGTRAGFQAVQDANWLAGSYVASIGPEPAGANYLPLNFGTGNTATITVLLDPRGSIHATAGILPTAELNLPPQFSAAALANMSLSFRVGPLLTDPLILRMPQPADSTGQWTWAQLSVGTGGDSSSYPKTTIVEADDTARLSTPSSTRDGWLVFTPTPPQSP
jgi:hypothetical protein